MRILMLDNEFPPLGGGTGVVNYHLLEEFARHPDVWVDLVTSSRTRGSYEQEQFAERIAIYKVPVDNQNIHHSTNVELLRYSGRGLRLSYELARRKRYDLSFAFAGVPAGAMSYALRLLTGLPYIVSLQGPDVPGFEARYNTIYPVLKPILRRVWADAAYVTAISEAHRDLAHQLMPHLPIPIIYNGVDDRSFTPRTSRPEGPIHLICVGRLIERKGQHHLLEAFAQLRAGRAEPLRLTFVGTGDAEDQLKGLAAGLGIAEDVSFLGFVAREAMPAVYHTADLFVLPSQSEGMSIALLEAMAAGLPVVVSDTGGTSELVRADQNGQIVPWADVPALVAALARMLAQRERWGAMGAASRATALQFRWEAVAQEYLDLCGRTARRGMPVTAGARP